MDLDEGLEVSCENHFCYHPYRNGFEMWKFVMVLTTQELLIPYHLDHFVILTADMPATTYAYFLFPAVQFYL